MRTSQQIGWSQEAKLLWNVGKQLDRLTKSLGYSIAPSQTTTTTTTPPPPPSPTVMIPYDARFDIPAYGSFTIEWFMKMANDNGFPRIYSIGQYPARNAVSIEGDTLYVWMNSQIVTTYTLVDYIGQWVHIAIMRYFDLFFGGNFVGIFVNGVKVIDTQYEYDVTNSQQFDLYIGSENAENTYYNGLLSNFRWSLINEYDGAGFPVPATPLGVTSQTKLLIFQGNSLAAESIDQSGLNTPSISDCVYNADNPFIGYEGSLQFGTV